MGSKMAEFHISFSKFRETRIVEVAAMTLDSVTSNIGGAMGVCLGASLITLTELLVFLCQFCLNTVRQLKQNRVAPVGPDSDNGHEIDSTGIELNEDTANVSSC